MAKIELTVRQILNLGLWDQVCEYRGWEPHIIREGRIEYDDLVEFDDTFQKEVNENTFDKKVRSRELLDQWMNNDLSTEDLINMIVELEERIHNLNDKVEEVD